MTMTEVIPIVQTLPHSDKFKLMQFLLSQLAKEEGISLLESHDSQLEKLQSLLIEGEKSGSDGLLNMEDIKQEAKLQVGLRK